MSIIGDILTLERSIPESLAIGILSGKYSVHGGVIRNATGQIVRHLVPAAAATNLNPFGILSLPFDIINTFQLKGIAEATQQLLNLGHATMALSGLNLAVSAVGFAAMYASLNEVKSHLEKIDRKLTWIKDFLDTGRRAAILSAAEELSSLPEDPSHRSQILFAKRDSLGQAAMHYLEHWDQSDELLEAMSYQHFYCTAFLMKARCSAELGMFDKAILEIAMGRAAWQQRCRRIAKDMILGDAPQRFLGRDNVKIAPTAKIAGWMDFAHNEQRGFDWIDSLRADFDESSWPIPFGSRKKPEMDLVTYMDNLVARNSVIDGYESQYRFFGDNRLTPTLFDKEVQQLPEVSANDGIYILAPIETRAE